MWYLIFGIIFIIFGIGMFISTLKLKKGEAIFINYYSGYIGTIGCLILGVILIVKYFG